MIRSEIIELGTVRFPAFSGERAYMVPFRQCDGLPSSLSRWQESVDAMLAGIKTDKPIYVMVDQSPVKRGSYHRRPGLHVDGNWVGVDHHHPSPGHRHPEPDYPLPRHAHAGRHNHSHFGEYTPELLLLASDVQACRAYVGDFHGAPAHDGDCGHIDFTHGQEIMLKAGRAYIGTATTLHETLPAVTDCLRTVIRLNIPGEHLPLLQAQRSVAAPNVLLYGG